jgi:hypothetical protein
MEKAIKNLENKLNNFIGFSKDPITTAEARGFKSGLMWAIDTLKTIRDQEHFEEDNDCTCDKCGKESRGLHSCPFDEEFNSGYSDSCNCCDSCRRECLMDI